MEKFQAKQAGLVVVFKVKAVDDMFWSQWNVLDLSFTSISLHSTKQNIIFQHYYQPYCDYLLKMGCIDKEQAIFEQLCLSDFKKWS